MPADSYITQHANVGFTENVHPSSLCQFELDFSGSADSLSSTQANPLHLNQSEIEPLFSTFDI
ncbi:hypothetical protein [Acaryochloris marina]|uniref:Uncharacterized protein n=1 Tax=Acaryochloris marina (strain MBIC 11017) TaxID=329726 RepID=B0C017_ACAM1|nr:hypothetical protein [Acaryochloris marina]ABW28364.1 hypothetical protein AM1_3370 [Acaryochloris marina MBIC11017]